MGIETILAIIAAFSIIASAVNMAMAFKMNEDWSKMYRQMNKDWAEFYKKLSDYRIGIVEDKVKEEETWKRS